jgi:hypothetical protein
MNCLAWFCSSNSRKRHGLVTAKFQTDVNLDFIVPLNLLSICPGNLLCGACPSRWKPRPYIARLDCHEPIAAEPMFPNSQVRLQMEMFEKFQRMALVF